jgi:hypothetical protein
VTNLSQCADKPLLQAHIWDSKKQVYLGGFDEEVQAAKAHDVMAIKCRGPKTIINLHVRLYAGLIPIFEKLTRVSFRGQ